MSLYKLAGRELYQYERCRPVPAVLGGLRERALGATKKSLRLGEEAACKSFALGPSAPSLAVRGNRRARALRHPDASGAPALERTGPHHFERPRATGPIPGDSSAQSSLARRGPPRAEGLRRGLGASFPSGRGRSPGRRRARLKADVKRAK